MIQEDICFFGIDEDTVLVAESADVVEEEVLSFEEPRCW
jgi:hypothetical protein